MRRVRRPGHQGPWCAGHPEVGHRAAPARWALGLAIAMVVTAGLCRSSCLTVSSLPLPGLQANPGAQPHPPGSPQAGKGAGGSHRLPWLGGRPQVSEAWGRVVKRGRGWKCLEDLNLRSFVFSLYKMGTTPSWEPLKEMTF